MNNSLTDGFRLLQTHDHENKQFDSNSNLVSIWQMVGRFQEEKPAGLEGQNTTSKN